LALGLALLAVATFLSVAVGSINIPLSVVWDALFESGGPRFEREVINEARVPRTVICVAVGAALGVAGAISLTLTRNPLGSPDILGVNAGASLAIVVGIYLGEVTSPSDYVWLAFVGAIGASVLVWLLAIAGGRPSPTKLVLAGVVITTLFTAWMTIVLLSRLDVLSSARIWLVGSVSGRTLDGTGTVIALMLAGLLGGLALAPSLNVLALGEDVARSLGQRVTLIKVSGFAVIVTLSATAVSLAGPIGFLALAVPHIASGLVRWDHRWLLPYCVLGGALVLTVADILGRIVLRPTEMPVGVVTALVGAPFLIQIARRARLSEL
jgi:iron complex transport system permease protein